jgi:hypothetical protein
VQRIGALFERAYAVDAEPPTWPEVEALLTEGYANALALEGERSDIESRIGTLVRDRSQPDPTHELRALSARHAEIDRNVRWLRSLLTELRDFATDVRDGNGNGGPQHGGPQHHGGPQQ